MNKIVNRFTLRLAVVFLATSFGAVPCLAQGAAGEPASGLYAVIDAFLAHPPINHDEVERITGARLTLKSSGVFDDYTAQDLEIGGLQIESMDYRQPSPALGSSAKRGPILVLKLQSGCVDRSQVQQRYAELTLADIPRGRSPKEQTYYARQEAWGALSFGFPESSPDCLKTIVISVRLPTEAPSLLR